MNTGGGRSMGHHGSRMITRVCAPNSKNREGWNNAIIHAIAPDVDGAPNFSLFGNSWLGVRSKLRLGC